MRMYSRKLKLKMLSALILVFILFVNVINPTKLLAQINDQINEHTNNTLELNVGASLKDQLDELQKKIDENKKIQEQYKSQIINLESDINSKEQEIPILENQVFLLNEEIRGKELILNELELKIELLENDIEELKIKIKLAEEEIERLEEETDGRIKNMYISQKRNLSTTSTMFSSDGPSSLIKSDTYRQAMQDDTNNKLNALKETRIQLDKDKSKIEEDKITVDKNRHQVEEETISLEQKKVRVDQQKQLYLAKIRENGIKITDAKKMEEMLTQEEKELRSKYDSIQSAMLAKNEVANGVPIKKGTVLGQEGDTGYAYGRHLHFGVSVNGVIQNPCNFLSAYGCGGDGSLGTPLAGAIFTSGFRTASRPTHNAIDVSTGGSGAVVAAHDGYVYFFFEPCPSWAGVCNGGGAIVAKVCEVDGCSSGMNTVYYHLSCTTEPSDSPRSCNK